ncbi:MAG TPA: hypothetical protein VMV01_09885 [Planctomycetota bacterium]|nr:hypothetical protein [Planctomycetota bacterium]
MGRPNRRALHATGLLVLVLLAAVALLPLLGGPALLLPAAGWVALAMAGFILLQLAVFRLLGLRSQADEEPGGSGSGPDVDGDGDGDADGDHEAEGRDRDWRAWRG